MLTHAVQIAADVAALHKMVEGGLNIHDAILTLTNDLRAANESFNLRQEVLNQVSVDSIAKQNQE